MVERFEWEFVAEYPTRMRKVVRWNRSSRDDPRDRGAYAGWEHERGERLYYHQGTMVESPNGPGMFCYRTDELTDDELANYLAPYLRVLQVEAPPGAHVRCYHDAPHYRKGREPVRPVVCAVNRLWVLT